LKEGEDFLIYPNLSSGLLNIVKGSHMQLPIKVLLYSADGSLIKKKSILITNIGWFYRNTKSDLFVRN